MSQRKLDIIAELHTLQNKSEGKGCYILHMGVVFMAGRWGLNSFFARLDFKLHGCLTTTLTRRPPPAAISPMRSRHLEAQDMIVRREMARIAETCFWFVVLVAPLVAL